MFGRDAGQAPSGARRRISPQLSMFAELQRADQEVPWGGPQSAPPPGATVLDRAQPAPPSKARQHDAFRKLRELTAQLRAEGIPAHQVASHLRKLADGIEGE